MEIKLLTFVIRNRTHSNVYLHIGTLSSIKKFVTATNTQILLTLMLEILANFQS